MAAKSALKGITVEIGAETKGFSAAIKALNAEAKSLAKDLQNVEKSLKLNPGDIESVYSKMKLLGEIANNSAQRVSAIEQAISKLNQKYADGQANQDKYKEALESLNEALKNGKITQEEYEKSLAEIEKKYNTGNISQEDYERELKSLTRQLESANYEYNRTVDELEAYEKQTVRVKDATEGVATAQKDAAANAKTFADKMSDIKKEADNVSSNLKIVNERLKLDPNNVELTKKKMDLLKEASEIAAKKVKTIEEAIADLNNEYEDKSSQEYNDRLKDLNEQLKVAKSELGLAQDKVTAYDRELKDAAKTVDNLGEEQKETNKNVKDMKPATEEAGSGTSRLADIIKGKLLSDAISKGIGLLVSGIKSIAKAAVNTLKDIATGIVNFTKESLSIAEENRQTLAKVGQVYGELSQQVIDWSKNAADSLGLTSGEAQEAAATFGNMFAALDVGIVKTDKIDTNFALMSTDLVQLAADVAAFNNTTTANVLDAFQSGLAGTSRQLREYGIVITAAQVEQKALELGLKANKDELTEGDKIVARYALMMEQAAHQSGQFARESDSATVQTQVLKAKIRELQGEIGEKLIPVQAKFLDTINDFLSSEAGQELFDSITESVGYLADEVIRLLEEGKFEEWIEKIKEKIPEFTQGIKDAAEWIGNLLPKVEALIDKLLSLFGIETEERKFARETKEAFESVRGELDDLADKYSTNLDLIQKVVEEYALKNGITSKEVYENWADHKEGVEAILSEARQSYMSELEQTEATIASFASANKLNLEDILGNWEEYEPLIKEYAAQMGTDYADNLDSTLAKLQEFAQNNGVSLGEVLANWEYYKPLVKTQMDGIASDAEVMEAAYDQHVSKLAPDMQEALDEFSGISYTHFEIAAQRANSIAENLKRAFQAVWDLIKKGMDTDPTPQVSWGDQPTTPGSGYYVPPETGGWTFAQGGYTPAGRMIRVNDDAGHRPEMFIPSVPGMILNGNQTDRIVNNNNSRTVGDVHIHVNSYGMDLATVSDELGYALQQKLRMSGATL